MPNDQLRDISPALLQDLVDANHILYRQRVVDGFGHVSARHPLRPNLFIIARSMAPALVTRDDLMVLDLSGRPVRDDAPAPLSGALHSRRDLCRTAGRDGGRA